MFEVNFSTQALGELKKLNPLAQLAAVEPLSNLKTDQIVAAIEPIKKFTRAGVSTYRLKSGDLRYYFIIKNEVSINVLYILHQHTLEDFLLRNSLPITETQLAEQHSKFWKYLESLTKTN
jgi:mRNA-degrading endonuclease RelE of RelBE toxin-antitoxin system